jgi:hypothetical protein
MHTVRLAFLLALSSHYYGIVYPGPECNMDIRPGRL